MTPKEIAEALLGKRGDEIAEIVVNNYKVILSALEAYEPWVWTKNLVAEQAEDPGLWFPATTAPERHLQQALRQLHLTVELSMKPKPPEEI